MLLTIVVSYLVVVLIVFLNQRNMMYVPYQVFPDPAAIGVPEMKMIEVTTKDGLTLKALYKAPDNPSLPVIVLFHGNGGSIGVLATPESGHQVNSNTGELGVDNTILNADEGSTKYDEKITLAFGTQFSGATITQKAILNDVSITGVDVGSGTDSFTWVAIKNGLQVGSGGNVMDTVSGQNLIGDQIHVDGGYDTLVLTMVSGDFKMSGFTYSQQGESFDTILNFGYSATDGDGDAIAGGFSVTVTDDASTTTALAGTGDLATITSTGQDYMTP